MKIKILGQEIVPSRPTPPPKPFDYFGTPDGEDVFPKLWYALKPAAMVAFATSTVDVMLYSHPKTYLQAVGRYIHFTAPIMSATAAFVITHNLAASIRQKDDKLNWFLGGMAPGIVFGIWRKSPVAGFAVGFAGGMAGILKKHAVQKGWILFPETKPQEGGFWSARQDWTLLKPIPGNWTTGKD